MRSYKRKDNQSRPIEFKDSLQTHPAASVLAIFGKTIVNCSVSIENKVPPFLDPETQGWLSSEYSMLPGATHERFKREASKGKLSGRTMEIQRLIGRSLRASLNLNKIPGFSFTIDCDVIQADGGTRTASISGASVALFLATRKLLNEGSIEEDPFSKNIAAISLGIVKGNVLLDLDYQEDSQADVDMNCVMDDQGNFIELQASSEKAPLTPEQLTKLIEFGKIGSQEVLNAQQKYINSKI